MPSSFSRCVQAMILRLVGRAERDVMHAAGALPRHRQILALDHMQFGGRSALAHRKHVDLRRASGAA